VQTEKLILGMMGAWLALLCLASKSVAQSIQAAGFDPTPVTLNSLEVRDQRAVTAMDLLTLRDPKGLSISPDGKYVAFVVGQAVYATNAYRSGLFVIAADGKHQARSLGTAGMPHWDGINQWVEEAPQWSPDGREIWYRTRLHTGERWQVWCWSLRSGRRRQLTRIAGDVESYRYVPGKDKLLLTVLKARTSETSANSGPSGIRFTGQIRPYQSISLLQQLEFAKQATREDWTYDLRTHREALAPPDEKRGSELGGDLNRDERRAFAKYHPIDGQESPNAENAAYLYEVNDASISRTWSRRLLLWSQRNRTLKEVTPAAYFVDQLWWNSDGAALYFTKRDGLGRAPELWKVSPDGSNPELVFQAPAGAYVSSFAPDKNGRYFACLYETNVSPPRISVLDTLKQSVRTLVELNPGFDRLRRSPGERIEGANRYGDRWFGYLVKPLDYKSGARYPLIVTTYRSGDYFLRGGSGDENPVQVYAAHGFAVLSFDVGAIRNLRPGSFDEKLQDWASPTASLEDAIHRLADQGIVDPARVGIAGFSHGEEIAGYAVSHTTLFRAAIGAAFYDPCFYFLGGSDWWGMFENWGLGGWPEGQAKSNWQHVAMSMNADRIRTPILENASDTEYLIYLPLYRSLMDLGKPVELYIYTNELHVRNQPRHRLEIYQRNLDWFMLWLGGKGQFPRDADGVAARPAAMER